MRLSKRSAIGFVLVGVLVCAALLSVSIWFNHSKVGWLIESVEDVNQYRENWQAAIDHASGITHPAILHNLPNNCICRALTIKHAGQISAEARENGFNIYQIGTEHPLLGDSVSINEPVVDKISPIIAITDVKGRITYVGAYSDGIRCNQGNSMVANFIQTPMMLPTQPVVGLDVQTCRCINP